MSNTQQLTNYEMFLKTVNSLRYSQGFYSRLAHDLEEMSDEDRENLKNEINSQPQFNNEVDVVLFLEG